MSRVFEHWYDRAESYLSKIATRTGYDSDYLMGILDEALEDFWKGDTLEGTLDEVLLDVAETALELDY